MPLLSEQPSLGKVLEPYSWTTWAALEPRLDLLTALTMELESKTVCMLKMLDSDVLVGTVQEIAKSLQHNAVLYGS